MVTIHHENWNAERSKDALGHIIFNIVMNSLLSQWIQEMTDNTPAKLNLLLTKELHAMDFMDAYAV